MEVNVKIEGIDRLKRSTEALKKQVAVELSIGLEASARKIESEAKRSILTGIKSGKVYKRRTVLHRASAPGQAPANDTGRLVNSFNMEYVRGTLQAIISAGRGTVKYARMLEFGTARMAARPFLFPAAERSKAWISKRLSDAVDRAIKKTAKK